MRRRSSNGALWALLASLCVHIVIGLWMALKPAPPPPKPQVATVVPIHWIEPPAPPKPVVAEVKPPEPPKIKPLPTTQKKKDDKTPEPQQPVVAQTPSQTPSTSPGPSSPNAPTADSPMSSGLTLVPGIGTLMRMPEASDAEPSHGTTIRNGPGEKVDEVALHEYQGERLSHSVGDDLSREAAHARFANGFVPPFFRRFENSMRSKASDAVTHSPRTSGETLRDVASVLLAPSISPEAANKVANSPLGRSVTAGNVVMPSADDQRFREAGLQSLAQTEAIRERISAPKLRAVIELTQDARGTLADVKVVERSGDPVFDDSAIHLSRKVVRDLPDNDEMGLGTSWWRSRWQFTWEPPEVRVKLMEAWPMSAPSAQ